MKNGKRKKKKEKRWLNERNFKNILLKPTEKI